MADEEDKKDEETSEEAPEAAEEQAAPEAAEETEAPAEDEADAPAEEEPAPAEAADDADEAPAADAAPAADEDEEAPITRKQFRKLKRSKHAGEARPQRSPEERAAERLERRSKAAAERRRYRAGRGKRSGEPGQGTPAAQREPGAKKVRQGRVVSAKADKTITVRIDVVRRHPQYEKVVRRSATLHAHDAQNEANEGDTVRVVETRPLSRTKRWRLVEVVEKAR